MKYDGCRMLASVGGGREPVLWTRNMNVVTPSYPEIAEALTAAFGGRGRIVLDGELVVSIRASPRSDCSSGAMGVAHATKPLQRRIPVTFLPFDVLALDEPGPHERVVPGSAGGAGRAGFDHPGRRRPAHHRPSALGKSEQQNHAECREKCWYGRDFGQTVDIDLPSGPAEPILDQACNPHSQFGFGDRIRRLEPFCRGADPRSVRRRRTVSPGRFGFQPDSRCRCADSSGRTSGRWNALAALSRTRQRPRRPSLGFSG